MTKDDFITQKLVEFKERNSYIDTNGNKRQHYYDPMFLLFLETALQQAWEAGQKEWENINKQYVSREEAFKAGQTALRERLMAAAMVFNNSQIEIRGAPFEKVAILPLSLLQTSVEK